MSRKLYRYKKSILAPHFMKRSAVDVLHDQMVFYEEKSISLLLAIKKELKENSPTRGDLLVTITKNLLHCKDMAIECAHKLAPYQAPKLQSIEVKKKITHKFVIQGPTIAPNNSIWLDQVNQMRALPAPDKIIDHSNNAEQVAETKQGELNGSDSR